MDTPGHSLIIKMYIDFRFSAGLLMWGTAMVQPHMHRKGLFYIAKHGTNMGYSCCSVFTARFC